MKFYLVLDPNGYRHLETAQVPAKAHGGTFQEIDIPTDKEGLKAAVQELLTAADEAEKRAAAAQAAAPAAPAESQTEETPAAEVSPPIQQRLVHQQVIDYILEDASGRQVEDVFTALGARFHQANKLAADNEAPAAG